MGTYHFDPRSAALNTEMELLVESRSFVSEMKKALEVDFDTVINDVFSMEDWLPTFAAAANGGKDNEIQEKVKNGIKVSDKTCKAYLDGHHQMDLLTKGNGNGARREKFYFSAAGHLNAIRIDDWKITFTEMSGDLPTAWEKTPAWPLLTNLRQDPFEYFNRDTAPLYFKWWADRMWVMAPYALPTMGKESHGNDVISRHS